MTADNRYAVEIEADDDIAMQRLHQAWALSALIYGGGFENFTSHNDEIQQNALWALHSLIGDARTALHRVQMKVSK
jgi:hypothetical protein